MDDFRYVLREQAAEYQARISLLANNLTLRERAKQLVSSAYKRQCESELGELFQLFDSVQAQLQILEDEEELRPAVSSSGGVGPASPPQPAVASWPPSAPPVPSEWVKFDDVFERAQTASPRDPPPFYFATPQPSAERPPTPRLANAQTLIRSAQEVQASRAAKKVAGPGTPAAIPRPSATSSSCAACFCDFPATELTSAVLVTTSKACGHGLCAGCLAHYCVSVVKPHRKCVVPCPHAPRDAGGCEALMPREAVVRAIAEDEVATRVFTEVEVEAAATGEGEALLYCPHCSEPMTRPPDGLLPPNRPTRCPACRHKFCAHCRTAWHKRRSCARHQAYLAGGGPAAPGAAGAGGPAAVAALRRCGVRTCPGCRQGVVKASGCNHMTCVCGSEFCYVCGKGYLLGRKLCMCDKFGAAPEAPTAVDYDALIRRVEPMPESEFAATDLDKLMEQFRVKA